MRLEYSVVLPKNPRQRDLICQFEPLTLVLRSPFVGISLIYKSCYFCDDARFILYLKQHDKVGHLSHFLVVVMCAEPFEL